MLADKSKKNLWFPNLKQNKNIKIRLFCLPFAGGNISTYQTWHNCLPDSVNVCPVQLPGRGNRINEDKFTNLHSLVEILAFEIKAFLDLPFFVFGHSMGAFIGFELVRKLQNEQIFAQHLFASGARAPGLPSRTPDVHNSSPTEFKKELLKLDGTPKEVFDHPELLDIMLPTLRADFKLVETYKLLGKSKIMCPITAFGGKADSEVFHYELREWENNTDSDFESHLFEGNHFFIDSNTKSLLRLIQNKLDLYL